MRPLEDIERDTRRQGAAYLSIGPDGRYEVWGYEADDDLRDLIARVRELEAERDALLDQNAALRKALEERRDTLERLVYLDPRESQRARLDEVREVLRLLSTPAPPEIERPAACPFWDGEHCCHATGRELERLRRVEAAAKVIKNRYVANEGEGEDEHILCCFGAGVHPSWRELIDALQEVSDA